VLGRIAHTREDQHARLRAGQEIGDGIDAALAAQVEVEQDDVGRRLRDRREGFGLAGSGSDHFHLGLFAVDEPLEAPKDAPVIVHQHHADRIGIVNHDLGLP
jgi:hypothetical protein